jgi:hypothetical protein
MEEISCARSMPFGVPTKSVGIDSAKRHGVLPKLRHHRLVSGAFISTTMHSHKSHVSLATVLLAVSLASCNPFLNRNSDLQSLTISFRFHAFGQYDSNTGIFLKELNPGLAMARFSFTTDEKLKILGAINRTNFYQFPDTLPLWPLAKVDMPPGPYFLFVNDGKVSKKVVWYFPPDSKYGAIDNIAEVITDIIRKKAEYKVLPPYDARIEL